jgi:hypothetical protein
VVSYRAQRPSHLWHILTLITPIIMCIIIDLITIPALMPMPYYIFPNPSQNLKPEEEAYRLRMRLSSTSVVCCTALCALGRGPVASSQTQRPLCPDLSQNLKPEEKAYRLRLRLSSTSVVCCTVCPRPTRPSGFISDTETPLS